MEPEEVAALYLQHGEELRRFVAGLLRDLELAGDVLQTTFAQAVRENAEIPPDARKAWLFRVAFNEAMAIKRRRRVERQSESKRAIGPQANAEAPDDSLARAETVERVRQALADLPAEQQYVVRARIYENKTFAVIAAELNVPIGTVLTRMRLASKKLRQRLDAGD